MRIVWLSNKAITSRDMGESGTWLGALGRRLTASDEIELCNITVGESEALTRRDDGPIQQWLVPPSEAGLNGLPTARVVSAIIGVVKAFSPDLVHVWGTESYWGLFTARRLLHFPALLEIQGLKEPCARVYAGGLTMREQLSCIGLQEILNRSSIASGRRKFSRWGLVEREIIAGYRYITTQSPWVEAWVRARNTSARLFHAELALREPFYAAQPWSAQGNAVVFCSTAYSLPFKGLHDAVRAFALLKRRIPNARLRIAGPVPRAAELRRDGYAAWMNRLAASHGVADSIDWLGRLSAKDIVAELHRCSVMVMPSHCESYCMALAEALYLGVPAVTSHTGGTDWLARDEESALFFSAGDEVMCSHQLERALTDQRLASMLSTNARSTAMTRNNPSEVVADQMRRYRSIMDDGRAIESITDAC